MRGLDICLCGLFLLCRSLPLRAIGGAEHLIYIQLSIQTHLSNNRDPVSKQNSHCKVFKTTKRNCANSPRIELYKKRKKDNNNKRRKTKIKNSQFQQGLGRVSSP